MSRDYDKELNFQEAVANAYLAYTERDLILPENVDPNTKLGHLCSALQTFMQQANRPPINGSIPDMTAGTELYVQLQRIYKEQADQDLAQMTRIVQQQSSQAVGVSQDDIANFCANVYAVGHFATRSLQEEYTQVTTNEEMVGDWKMALMDPYEVPVHTPLLWYLGLRACHIFCKQEGRYPGVFVADVDDDAAACQKDAAALVAIYQQQVIPQYQLSDQTGGDGLLNPTNVANICQELTRYGNAEIHAVASVVGGVASQEAVKLITGQYIPVDNTYIYNGIVSVGGVYKF